MEAESGRDESVPIGDRLRQFLSWNRLSIKSFSDRSGVPYRTLQDYLTNKRKPGADHLASMGKAGVNLNWLLVDDYGDEDTPLHMVHWTEARKNILKANQALGRALVARCDKVTDEAGVDHLAQHGEPMTRLQLNRLWQETFREAVVACDAMETIISDLVAKGVSNDTVVDVVFATLHKRSRGKRLGN